MSLNSLILICPAEQHATANRFSWAMGHQDEHGNTYSLSFSPTGADPVTHRGMHAWAPDEFIEKLAGTAQGVLPPDLDLAGKGLSEADAWELLAVLTIDVRPGLGDARQHLDDVLAAEGLQEVQTPE